MSACVQKREREREREREGERLLHKLHKRGNFKFLEIARDHDFTRKEGNQYGKEKVIRRLIAGNITSVKKTDICVGYPGWFPIL